MTKKVILFSLQTFSTTGGIQKMTRTLAHTLNIIAQGNHWDFNLWSLYDSNDDLMPHYLPAEKFRGFGLSRWNFMLKTIFTAKETDVIILSHINLAMVGLLIKTINPKCKVWLIAHGIEVLRPLSILKLAFLKRCDMVMCVSNFTKQQMISRHKINEAICRVLNNAVDPFMKLPATFTKPDQLLKQYGLSSKNPVIFTLTRLASTEQYKGYDNIIKVISRLKTKFPGIKYVLSGKYDEKEKIRIGKLIAENEVEERVIITGFIAESQLPDYFLLADIFVLPSKKEGFGLVFIEALACGVPVVCGNADGSIDAIYNGKLGKAINTDDLDELENTLTAILISPLTETERLYLQKECLLHFNEKNYINKLEKMLVNT